MINLFIKNPSVPVIAPADISIIFAHNIGFMFHILSVVNFESITASIKDSIPNVETYSIYDDFPAVFEL